VLKAIHEADDSATLNDIWRAAEVILIGTHEKTVGSDMFQIKTPSIKGIYTLSKVNYKPIKRGQKHEKTGEVVHYRKVEESDLEAIKKAFPDLAF